jgi:GAF domain-containing protein/tetratricopeptide (TPR) repeat protein
MEKDVLSTRLDELQAAAERARTAYQWQEAAGYYTQALELPDLPPKVEYSLLDGRAYAYQRTVNLTDQERDLQRMLELAQEYDNRQWQMEALLRLAEVSQDNGELSTSREQAEAALRMAKAERVSRYEGWAYYLLARIDSTTGRYDQAMEPLNRALELFKAEGDLAWESRVYRDLAFAGHRLGQNIIEAAECCMRPAQKLGDRLLEAQALHIMGIAHINEPATFRMYTEKSLEMYQSIQDMRGVATLSHNMGIYYRDFGLYKRSQSYLERAYQMYEGSGNLRQRTTTLFTLGFIAYLMGDYQKARSINEEALEVFQEKGFRELEAFAIMTRSMIDHAEGNYAGAVQGMEYSLELMKDSQFFVSSTSSILAHIHYQAGELEKALETAEESIRLAENIPENDTGLAWAVRAWVRQDLYGDAVQEEAWHDIQFAYRMMMKPVAALTDWGMRRSYLHRSPFNNEVVISWARMAAARGMSLKSTGDQIPPDDQIHDPFKRLLDIGERMANQHDPEELLTFIVDEFFELSGAERAFIALLPEGESERPQLRLASGMTGTEPEAVFEQAQDTISQALLARHAILVQNAGDVPPGEPSEIHQRSLLILPLVSQSQVLGVLYADIRTIFGAFTNQDSDLLSMFANQAASALESAELVRSLEQRVAERTQSLDRRVRELRLINSIQAGLVSHLSFDALIDEVGLQLEAHLELPDNLGIVLLDTENQRMRLEYFSVNGKRYPSTTIPLGQGLSSIVIQTGKPLLLSTRAEIDALQPVIPKTARKEVHHDHMSWLGVPLLRESEAIGVLLIARYEDNAFDQSDLNLLETLAHSLSVALSNVHSFESERQRNAELALINSIQAGLSSQLDFDRLVDLVGNHLEEYLKPDNLGIAFYDAENGLITTGYYSISGKRYPNSAFPYGQGISTTVIRTRKPVMLQTRREIDAQNPVIPTPAKNEIFPDHMSWLGVPLMREGEVMGVLFLSRYRDYAFAQSDLSLMETLAHSLSVALANARSFQAERQRSAELALINRIQEDLVANLDLNAIYQLIADEVPKLFNVRAYALVSYDRQHEQVQVHVSNFLEPQAPPTPFSRNSRRLIEKREVLYFPTRDDVENQYRPDPEDRSELPDWVQSSITVPTVVDNQVTGAIVLLSEHPMPLVNQISAC